MSFFLVTLGMVMSAICTEDVETMKEGIKRKKGRMKERRKKEKMRRNKRKKGRMKERKKKEK